MSSYLVGDGLVKDKVDFSLSDKSDTKVDELCISIEMEIERCESCMEGNHESIYPELEKMDNSEILANTDVESSEYQQKSVQDFDNRTEFLDTKRHTSENDEAY